MMKTWLLDEMFRVDRWALKVEGGQEEWGAGDSVAEQEDLPPPPSGITAKPGNGRIIVSWDPVPDAMYYNLYFMTTKGVQIKFSELTRPIASAEDFKPTIGVKKEKATCIEGPSAPHVHDDLANGTCYHYVVTVVTPKGESHESDEVMAIPSPYLLTQVIGHEGTDDGEFSSPTGIALDKDGQLYVADTDNHSIQKFDKEGKFLARWAGEPSSQEGEYYYPRGLAVSPDGQVFVADSGNNRVQKLDTEGQPVKSWGKFGFAWRGADMGKFDVPWGITTDQDGNIYVSDTSNARIQKFQSDGTPLLKWGRDGSFDGAFFFPRGIAVDFVGNIYVADEGNNRIQKFDQRGSYLTKWGREGSGPGQFKAPWGIACDALGNVYVVDQGNHRIQKFDGNGTFQCAWGNRGKTEGQLNYPSGITVDKEGNVYVVDTGNSRVLKYVPTEEEITRGQEAQQPKDTTEHPSPRSVAVKPGDTETVLSWLDVPGAVSYNLYFQTQTDVTTQTATKIEGVTSPFTHAGLTNDVPYFYGLSAVYEDGTESALCGEVTATPVLIDITAPQTPNAVINHWAFMTNSPEVVVTVSATDMDSGVGAYYISENPMTPMAGTPGWVEVQPFYKFSANVPFILSPGDGQKTIYVWFKDVGGNVSTPASASTLLNTSGYLCVSKWGKPGRGASLLHGGEFMAPLYGMAIDQQGSVFVVDNGNNRVQKFDPTGNFIILWGNFGAANANFHNPTGIACDGKGDVFVVDTNNHRVQKFDGKLGGYLMKFGSRGNGEGQFNSPWGIAVDRVRGYIYVVDSANFRVQKFDMTGEFIMSWGSFGNGDGQFYFPRGVAVDQADGFVYVVDMGNHRIQKFDTSTNVLPQLLTKWGGGEAGHASSPVAQEAGQFRSPWGIAVDGQGDVFVTDTGNHRVEKFDREGNFITQWGGFGGRDGQFNFPYGIAIDAKGSVFVIDSGSTRVQQFLPADEGGERLQEQAEMAAELENTEGATKS